MSKMIKTYERVSQRLLNMGVRLKPFCMFEGGRLLVGTQSLHRSKFGCKYRMFWRMKIRVRRLDK